MQPRVIFVAEAAQAAGGVDVMAIKPVDLDRDAKRRHRETGRQRVFVICRPIAAATLVASGQRCRQRDDVVDHRSHRFRAGFGRPVFRRRGHRRARRGRRPRGGQSCCFCGRHFQGCAVGLYRRMGGFRCTSGCSNCGRNNSAQYAARAVRVPVGQSGSLLIRIGSRRFQYLSRKPGHNGHNALWPAFTCRRPAWRAG